MTYSIKYEVLWHKNNSMCYLGCQTENCRNIYFVLKLCVQVTGDVAEDEEITELCKNLTQQMDTILEKEVICTITLIHHLLPECGK